MTTKKLEKRGEGGEDAVLWREPPILVGCIATFCVGVIGMISLLSPACAPNVLSFDVCTVNKLQYLYTATPNEVGDTLAGFAGAIAFIWIICTVWLQGSELKEQRKQFVRMAEAQSVEAKQLISLQAHARFLAKVERFFDVDSDWAGAADRLSVGPIEGGEEVRIFGLRNLDDAGSLRKFRLLLRRICERNELLLGYVQENQVLKRLSDAPLFDRLVQKLEEIRQDYRHIPEDQKEHFSRAGTDFDATLEALKNIRQESRLWVAEEGAP